MISQQILTTVMTRIDVDMSTDHGKPNLMFFFTTISKIMKKISQDLLTIYRKKKDGGCTFSHNTLRTKLSPLGIWKDMV